MKGLKLATNFCNNNLYNIASNKHRLVLIDLSKNQLRNNRIQRRSLSAETAATCVPASSCPPRHSVRIPETRLMFPCLHFHRRRICAASLLGAAHMATPLATQPIISLSARVCVYSAGARPAGVRTHARARRCSSYTVYARTYACRARRYYLKITSDVETGRFERCRRLPGVIIAWLIRRQRGD